MRPAHLFRPIAEVPDVSGGSGAEFPACSKAAIGKDVAFKPSPVARLLMFCLCAGKGDAPIKMIGKLWCLSLDAGCDEVIAAGGKVRSVLKKVGNKDQQGGNQKQYQPALFKG